MNAKGTLCYVLPFVAIAISNALFTPAAEGAVSISPGNAWVWQNPLPQGNNLNAVSCPIQSQCFAVGDLGTILLTTNGGSTWVGQSSPTTQNLRSISCPSTSFCVAVGDSGTVVTYDSFCFVFRGISVCSSAWVLQTNTSISVTLHGVSCTNATVCLAVGGNTVYDNLQGGSGGWNVIGSANSTDVLTGISCPGTSNTPTCVAVGPVVGGRSGNVLKIFYGFNGFFNTFQLAVLTTGDAPAVTAISCTSTTNCLAVDDAGNSLSTFPTFSLLSWDVVVVDFELPLSGVSCFPGTTTCYAVGRSNLVFATFDGGTSWSSLATGQPTSARLDAVSCAGFGCVAVGPAGAVVTSSLGNWTSPQLPITTHGLTRLSCPTEGSCFAVGDGGTILHTNNGGASWTPQTSPTTQSLADISCPTTGFCVAVGANGTIIGYNGSAGTWSTQSSGTSQNLNAVSCPSTSVCFAAGGGIIATNDGGSTPWTNQVPFGTIATVNAIACTSPTNCVTVGGSEQTKETRDGKTWSVPLPIECSPLNGCPPTLRDVSCPVSTYCVAVGDNGTILTSSNVWTASPPSWTKLSSPTTDDLASVSCLFSTAGTACEAGSGGTAFFHRILLSSGTTWTIEGQLEPEPRGVNCTGSLAANAYQCIAVGTVGTILSKTVGSTGTGELTPRDGNSEVGEPTAFSLTWTVPGGQSWRDLQYVDVRLSDDAGIGLWARFLGGGQNAFGLLDAGGNTIAEGSAGSAGVLDSPTATLDLSKSSFQGTGSTGPSVTVSFVVTFKAPAAGNAQTPAAARVYDVEISAANSEGTSQAFEQVGHWVVRAANP